MQQLQILQTLSSIWALCIPSGATLRNLLIAMSTVWVSFVFCIIVRYAFHLPFVFSIQSTENWNMYIFFLRGGSRGSLEDFRNQEEAKSSLLSGEGKAGEVELGLALRASQRLCPWYDIICTLKCLEIFPNLSFAQLRGFTMKMVSKDQKHSGLRISCIILNLCFRNGIRQGRSKEDCRPLRIYH